MSGTLTRTAAVGGAAASPARSAASSLTKPRGASTGATARRPAGALSAAATTAVGGAGTAATADERLSGSASPVGGAGTATAGLLSRTTNAKRSMVRSGTLVCIPFETSAKPFVKRYPTSIAYGNHNTILNPPNKDRTTTVRADFTATSVTPQSAGCGKKMPVPYHPSAFRNRVKNDPKRYPPPFKSTLTFDMGVLNKSLHPYRTMSAITQAPSATPMTDRLGFTNAYVTAEIAKRLHKPMYAS